MNSQIPKLTGYLRTNWSRDPFTFGSYSYVPKDLGMAGAAALSEPVGQHIFFAGEATHPRYGSTVHAAYETGIYAADTILNGSAANIAIIGAGISGLCAAHRIADKGRTATVFEARDRIGGRVWTDTSLGLPADLGASWIHGVDGNPLTDLSDCLGLERIHAPESYILRSQDGVQIEMVDAPLALLEEIEIQTALGAERELLDPAVIGRGDGYSGHDVIFGAGYSAIFEAFEGDYQIVLNSPVSSVEIVEDIVRLGFDEGQPRDFDAVIVTVPLGALKRGAIAFTPPLPKTKRDAITAMEMALLDKVYLRFEEAFWDKSPWIFTLRDDLPRGQFTQWMNLEPYFEEPIIVAFNGAKAAHDLADLSDEIVINRAVETIGRAYFG